MNKTGLFKPDITTWNRRPQHEKTRINFKTHFRQAHADLKETTDLTLGDVATQRNLLVQQVVDGVSISS